MDENKNKLPKNPNKEIIYDNSKLRDIWFAGGCFWGVQAYFDRIYGVANTTVGYANGKTENPSYHDINKTGHVETVHVRYDPNRISLKKLLEYLFIIIDPISLNKQGGDAGTQYRTGIYYNDESDRSGIFDVISKEQEKHLKPIVTEVLKLDNFYLAEEYHQSYLDKNLTGYCHVDFSALNKITHEE